VGIIYKEGATRQKAKCWRRGEKETERAIASA